MGYRIHIPGPPLSEFVDLLWFYEGVDRPHTKECVLPTGTMELIVDLHSGGLRVYEGRSPERSQTFDGALVCGAHSEFFAIDAARQASVMGVHFKPGGASPFFGLPARELRDAHVPLDALWGAGAGELRDRLLEAGTPGNKFRILEKTLLARTVASLARHPVVAFALREFGGGSRGRTVSDVTGRIGLSPRRFIEVFSGEVGLTPKLFCRVRRFQEALGLIGDEGRVEWGDIALGCGYFDQAHFIHDFRAFSGLNPTAYLANRTEHLNHVPLPE